MCNFFIFGLSHFVIVNAEENENSENEISEVNEEEFLQEVEEYFYDKNTTVVDELNDTLLKYQNQYSNTSSDIKKTKINTLINKVNLCIDNCNLYYTYMTYNLNERILLPPSISDVVIASAIAYFEYNDWDLSAELLIHSFNNEELDSIYEPVNQDIVSEGTFSKDIVANTHSVFGNAEFKKTSNTIDDDLYFSIKNFQYVKEYEDEDSIIFHIRDRYDFDEPEKIEDIVDSVVKLMSNYEDRGILTPFISDIKVSMKGSVDYSYEISSGKAIINNIANNVESLSIPNKVLNIYSYDSKKVGENVEVIKIGAQAARNRTNLNSIILPEGISVIEDSAFENCSYLQSVTLPANLVAIGSSAFKDCGSLASITIPNGVTNIDSSAFENCSYLQSVTLPTNLVAIGSSAFKGCGSLGSITIPNGVTNIDSSAFENCSSLTSVTVNKSQEAITHIGENAFDGCSTSLQIIVPKNRLAEYKNKFYWSSYKNKIIPDSTDFDELNLHCLVDDSSDVTLSAGYNELYKLNVECNKSYKFMTSSGIELKVYDEYFDELYTGENTLYAYLSPGTYYLDVRYNSSTASGTITIDYELRWTHDGERVYYNDEHNLLTHLHETSYGTYFNKLYYINNNGAGFYKFQLNGTYSNNLPIIYDSGTLTIYNDSGRLETQVLNRYPNSSIMASSDDNQDTMYVYLPRNGYFYINVVMPSESYESLSLIVSPISSQNINLFNLNENADHLISVINNTDKGDYVETLNVEQTGKFTISYNYNGSSTDNFVFLLVKQNYNSTTNQYSFSTIINMTMNAKNNSFTYTGNLEAGKYYIGYLNKNDNSSVVANFVRLVTDSNNQKLLPDPDMSSLYGSEVRFNNGVCRGTNLTVGFTRFIYLDNTLDIRSQSRLDYYWYSSDENVASISDYGTLLGLSPGTVKIMSVYKNDPSVVYVKQFTVLPDTRTEDLAVEINESITYAESGQIYQISLTDTNSPYPLNSLYEWSVVLDESSYSVTVTEWGTFSMSGKGTIVLEGRSKLNPHLVVRFTLIVT